MNKIMTIKPDVRFVSDLGYMFFDDGNKTIRLTRVDFSQALINYEIAEDLVTSNPDFFELVESGDLAKERLKLGRVNY